MSNTFTSKVSGKVSSRGWAIALGLGAIVLATILLLVYLDRYRDRVSAASAPTPVLIAKQVIPAGTPGHIAASEGMYEKTTVPKREVLEGAIADPNFLVGRAAAVEILPAKQLTVYDFAAATTTTVDSQITGRERALSMSIDAIRGSLGQLKAGDEVDIYMASTHPGTGSTQIELFREAVEILAVPGPTSPGIILRTTTRDAPKLTYAAHHVGLYFVLRPAAGAKRTADVVGHAGNLKTRSGR